MSGTCRSSAGSFVQLNGATQIHWRLASACWYVGAVEFSRAESRHATMFSLRRESHRSNSIPVVPKDAVQPSLDRSFRNTTALKLTVFIICEMSIVKRNVQLVIVDI